MCEIWLINFMIIKMHQFILHDLVSKQYGYTLI